MSIPLLLQIRHFFYKWQSTRPYQSLLSLLVLYNSPALFFFASSRASKINVSIAFSLHDRFHQHSNTFLFLFLKDDPRGCRIFYSLPPLSLCSPLGEASSVVHGNCDCFFTFYSSCVHLGWVYNLTASPWLFPSRTSDDLPLCHILMVLFLSIFIRALRDI